MSSVSRAFLLLVAVAMSLITSGCKTAASRTATKSLGSKNQVLSTTADAEAADLQAFLDAAGAPYAGVVGTEDKIELHFDTEVDFDIYTLVLFFNTETLTTNDQGAVVFNDANQTDAAVTDVGLALQDFGYRRGSMRPITPVVGGEDYSRVVRSRIDYWDSGDVRARASRGVVIHPDSSRPTDIGRSRRMVTPSDSDRETFERRPRWSGDVVVPAEFRRNERGIPTADRPQWEGYRGSIRGGRTIIPIRPYAPTDREPPVMLPPSRPYR